MSKFRIDQYLALLLLSLVFLIPVKAGLPKAELKPPVELAEIHPLPVLNQAADQDSLVATLSAQSVLALDINSGVILLENNSRQKVAPASTTKLLTALVAKKTFALQDIISIQTTPLNVGHTIGFQVGEEFSVEDMLKALLINSGNDAAEILAQNHPQGRTGFIQAMNQLASDLHLQESWFMNPSGLDAAAHYSSAVDLSLIAKEVMKDDFLSKLVNTKQAIITNQAQTNQYLIENTNLLLAEDLGVVGIKTGTTDLAGEALITQLNRAGREVMIVVLGSQDRYGDTRAVINWIFSHYQWLNI